jgi:hypothetical protein
MWTSLEIWLIVLLFFDISRIKLDKNGGKTCFDNVKMSLFQAKIHLFCEIKKLERKTKPSIFIQYVWQ